MHRSGPDVLSVGSLPPADERWRTTLKVERITIDGNRWTAEISFTPVAFDPNYWLSRSEGFLVDSPDGGIGVVDEIVRTPDGDIALSVAGGWFGRRQCLIPANEVEEIRPGPQRILVRAAAVHGKPRGGRRRFPFNLLEGPPDQPRDRRTEPGSGHRTLELPPEHDIVQLLGTDDGR